MMSGGGGSQGVGSNGETGMDFGERRGMNVPRVYGNGTVEDERRTHRANGAAGK